jgi:hypothetical protein
MRVVHSLIEDCLVAGAIGTRDLASSDWRDNKPPLRVVEKLNRLSSVRNTAGFTSILNVAAQLGCAKARPRLLASRV